METTAALAARTDAWMAADAARLAPPSALAPRVDPAALAWAARLADVRVAAARAADAGSPLAPSARLALARLARRGGAAWAALDLGL